MSSPQPKDIRVFILAAGLGTRLRPLTLQNPKPLVKVAGRPMLDYVLAGLVSAGFREMRINIHYLPEQLEKYVEKKNAQGPAILSVQNEKNKILGSGGAIQLAAPWLFAQADYALVLNADNLLRLNYGSLLNAAAKQFTSGVDCVLATMPHPAAGRAYTGLLIEKEKILDFVPANPSAQGDFFHFPGVYVVHKRLEKFFQILPKDEEYSIVEKIWRPLAQEKKLGAWNYSGPYQDLGSVADLKIAEERIKAGDFVLGE